ncbi:undecaprenyl-diphosphate phosphatase [Pollutimonas thiosulfatoxidans]|uniref:Undecaprenyl-diphosphatase n=1 Tax=Pollutimonas thiosulfatoxidans TaxID=2028345 RepID=A0A410GC88_9BURK|nr:undecaprenyl-diphosphate phosphatase [Pollutimonas thiosulfatoxidans]MBF6618020.1 undecaprenyl-diphosphate phosphatase [Candidimonas sp.]NYT44522.1 undecaprenyl-diphosphate phosphatase [Alcaligenaceae bacterium]QAA93889.1 undecaprenyl-diphosphatase [Pollutimonas thiosulfatoxidans]
MTDNTWFMLKALFLGLVEGFTEFIPVSSTAHLLLIGDWINFSSSNDKVFEVVIQFGSIMAVMWIFRARLWQLFAGVLRGERSEVLFTRNLLIAFLPAAVIGAVMIKYIKALFHSPAVFVVTLILGGLVMLWVERKPQYAKNLNAEQADAGAEDDSMASRNATARSLEEITWRQALVVGFAQCLAMVPGTSRSGATIISGMIAGIQRKTATEFSFFLAMPTMLAATVYDLYRNSGALDSTQATAIVVGFAAAFFSALLVVRAVLRFVSRRTYRPFAWYRIGLGIVVAMWLVWR